MDSYVICKVFQKEGPGPRNGAQYGRPFNEEDWNVEEVGIPFAESSALFPILPVTSNSSVLNDQNIHASGCNGSTSMTCLSGLMPSPGPSNPSHPNKQAVNDDGDDILSMLDIFIEDDTLTKANIAEGAPLNEVFDGLGDLDYWAAFNGFSSGQNAESSTNGMVTTGDVVGCGDWNFVEMSDLDPPLLWQTSQPESWSGDK